MPPCRSHYPRPLHFTWKEESLSQGPTAAAVSKASKTHINARTLIIQSLISMCVYVLESIGLLIDI